MRLLCFTCYLVSFVCLPNNAQHQILLESQANWHWLEAISNSRLNSIEEASNQTFWLSYDDKVIAYNGIKTTEYAINLKPAIGSISFTKNLPNGTVLAFGQNSIAQLSGSDWSWLSTEIGSEFGTQAIIDKQQQVWFISEGSLAKIDLLAEPLKVTRLPAISQQLSSLMLDHLGFIWTVDRKTGEVFKLNYKKNQLV